VLGSPMRPKCASQGSTMPRCWSSIFPELAAHALAVEDLWADTHDNLRWKGGDVMATKIQVVFYSMYGHIYQMAEAVAAGAREVGGTEVTLYQVAELAPDD